MKYILGLVALCAAITGYCQQEGSAFTATGRAVSTTFARDYESIGINPANLAWGTGYEGKNIAFGLMEVGMSAFSNALTKEQLFGGNSEEFNQEQAFANLINSATAYNVDISPVSFAFMNEKIGGFAVSTKDRFQYFSEFNELTADIMVNGFTSSYFDTLTIDNNGSVERIPNDPSQYDYDTLNILFGTTSDPKKLSVILEGTDINVSYTREFNLAYGRYIIKTGDNFSIAGGIGLKYVQGFGILKISSEDGELTAFSATSPDFGINFTSSSNNQADFSGAPFFESVGKGYGVDLGANMLVKGKLHLGVAINNIGSMKWKGNAASVKDTLFGKIESDGFESYNYPKEVSEIAAEDDFFEFRNEENLVVALPTIARFGASIDIKENKIHVGADIVVPLNDAPGNFSQPIAAIGGDFRVLPWLEFETGMQFGGNTQKRLNIPVGLTFHLGKSGTYEAGIASRDAVTWFREKSPNASVAFGFMRFRF